MINKNTLRHPSTLRKILKACRNAQKWGIDHVVNKKGQAFIAVRYYKGVYSFTDNVGANVYFPVIGAVTDGNYRGAFWDFLNKRAEKADHNSPWRLMSGQLVK